MPNPQLCLSELAVNKFHVKLLTKLGIHKINKDNTLSSSEKKKYIQQINDYNDECESKINSSVDVFSVIYRKIIELNVDVNTHVAEKKIQKQISEERNRAQREYEERARRELNDRIEKEKKELDAKIKKEKEELKKTTEYIVSRPRTICCIL